MQTKLLFIQALSSLQPGTGQGVGVIDQPVSREKATGLPYLPGSTIKGVLRDCWELERIPDLEEVFGQTTQANEPYAGSVSLMDGRLLLLPVRSLAGVFAWVTSPFILNRLIRDCKMGKIPGALPAAVTPSCPLRAPPHRSDPACGPRHVQQWWLDPRCSGLSACAR